MAPSQVCYTKQANVATFGDAKQANVATFGDGWETWIINTIVPPGLYLVSRRRSHVVDADDDFQTAGLLRVKEKLWLSCRAYYE